MGSNPSNYKGYNRPVETVNWNDCQDFVRKLNQKTGLNFRLPTEAEWEYAARGGDKSRGYKYSGSKKLDDVAWYTKKTKDTGIHDVKTKHANELGLYDMSGNIWEWCQDWFGEYSSSSQTDPTGPSSGSIRVYRGGSWGRDARRCRVSGRGCNSPGGTGSYLGLRLAL
jgi:formylglycine-generating enzyme required for sulfatase activity